MKGEEGKVRNKSQKTGIEDRKGASKKGDEGRNEELRGKRHKELLKNGAP